MLKMIVLQMLCVAVATVALVVVIFMPWIHRAFRAKPKAVPAVPTGPDFSIGVRIGVFGPEWAPYLDKPYKHSRQTGDWPQYVLSTARGFVVFQYESDGPVVGGRGHDISPTEFRADIDAGKFVEVKKNFMVDQATGAPVDLRTFTSGAYNCHLGTEAKPSPKF